MAQIISGMIITASLFGARIASITEKTLVRREQEWHFRRRTIGSALMENGGKKNDI